MQKIYWAYKHFTADEYKEHCNYGKHVVMALSPRSNFCINLTCDGKTPTQAFDTKEEAIFFIKETNKPRYFEGYGSHYELVELDPTSDEWYDIYDIYAGTNVIMESIDAYCKLPWYKKLFKKIMGSDEIKPLPIHKYNND